MADAAIKHMASNFSKLDKFKGVDFRIWQKKIHILHSSMSVVYVLTTPIPEDGVDNLTVEEVKKRAEWDNDDYVCRGLILKDTSSKKFLVSNFTNYKMTDLRPVMEQYVKLFGILGRFTQHKMKMDEAIQVSCVIDKLSLSWKDFKHTLKYKKEELNLVELGSHLSIEESLKLKDNDKPKGNNVVDGLKIFDEAMKSQDVAFWKEAINHEMNFIMGNNTWVLADLSPVARISTIRLLIAMASIYNLIIHQIDVKTAFLNGDLDEDVYMNQPQGFIMHGNENSHYIEKALKEFNYFDCTSVSTTMDRSEKIMPNNSQWVNRAGILVIVASKKQTCITGSTIESEFVVLAAAAPTSVRCDSTATLAKAYSQMYNGKSRHLGVRHNMIREFITNEVVSIEFVRSQQNLADYLTKALARDLILKSVERAVELLSRVQRVMHNNVLTPRSTDVVFKGISFAIQKGLAAQLVARLPSTTM
uniref:Zinc finger, CCHC-type n=1 Tax=Tanacetum cinerariifolium TaxID=118510 RepID=A0A6L2J912_TANCI|nr:zinc finger, CCHC-type [Tanacetum cinerariifolium]